MAFKINISGSDGKSWKLEKEIESLMGISVGENINGKDIDSNLEGYEFQILGGSDISGFPMYQEVEGIGLKKVLLTKGWGMKDSRKGIRLRRTVRGKVISEKIVQLNLKVVKDSDKKLGDIFPEQNKPEEKKDEKVDKVEEKKDEKVDKPEEKKEEKVDKSEEKK